MDFATSAFSSEGERSQFMHFKASVTKIGPRPNFPLPGTGSSDALGLWRPKGGKAAQDCGPERQFGHLSAEVARHALLGNGLPSNHERIRLDMISSVILAPTIAPSHTCFACVARCLTGVPARLKGGNRCGIATFRPFLRRDKVLKPGTDQSSLASFNRLSTSPVICCNRSPNDAFKVRHAWIAATVKVAEWSYFPLGSASQIVSGSNQICCDPRCFRAEF